MLVTSSRSRRRVGLALGLAVAGLGNLAPAALAAAPGTSRAAAQGVTGLPAAWATATTGPRPAVTATPSPTPTPDLVAALSPTLRAADVTFLGDSVLLGAERALRQRFGDAAVVDGAVSRQYGAGLERLRALRDRGALGEVVVIHLGNNGIVTPRQLAETITVTERVPHLLFVTVHVPRPWEREVNETLRSGVAGRVGPGLVDWHNHTLGQQAWFTADGVHLRPAGARAYADLVARAVYDALAQREPAVLPGLLPRGLR